MDHCGAEAQVQIKKLQYGKDYRQREYIFFTVVFNRYRDVSRDTRHQVRDRFEKAECECVLALPDSYRAEGAKTPLVLTFHGAGHIVNAQRDEIGGVKFAGALLDAGYAALDVCGAEPHGVTLGCPEHIFAAYKAYRYAVQNYNLSQQVLLFGESMGGHTAMNFACMFPSLALTLGLYYPRLNLDGITVEGKYCIGTWDKTQKNASGISKQNRIAQVYRFPGDHWCEENTIGFNSYKNRSFLLPDGKRGVIPPCPVKIWHGLADTVVDPLISQEYVESVHRAGCYAQLHLLDGVTHGPTAVMDEELVLWFDRFI